MTFPFFHELTRKTDSGCHNYHRRPRARPLIWKSPPIPLRLLVRFYFHPRLLNFKQACQHLAAALSPWLSGPPIRRWLKGAWRGFDKVRAMPCHFISIARAGAIMGACRGRRHSAGDAGLSCTFILVLSSASCVTPGFTLIINCTCQMSLIPP